MNEETLKKFNKELTALLKKYKVVLQVEDIPATKKIVVAPIKERVDNDK